MPYQNHDVVTCNEFEFESTRTISGTTTTRVKAKNFKAERRHPSSTSESTDLDSEPGTPTHVRTNHYNIDTYDSRLLLVAAMIVLLYLLYIL